MPIKLNISEKGKSWKVETEADVVVGKSIGDKLSGKDIKSDLEGYEFEITGGSDSSGFPLSKTVEGISLKRELLTKGFGMKDNYPGIRRRKTVRGRNITETIALVNLNVLKVGHKKLAEIFPDQNKAEEVKTEAAPAA